MQNRQRKKQLVDEISKLCNELTELQVDSDVKGAKKLVGRTVIVLVGQGYRGRKAIVTGPRGSSKQPMYWNLRMLDDGENIYKCKSSFVVMDSPQEGANVR